MKVKLRRSLALLIAVLQILTMYTPIAYANDFDGQVVEQVVEQLEPEMQENGHQELEQQVFEQESFIQQEISQEPQFTYGPYSGGVDGKKHAYEPFAEDKADSLVVAENAPTGSYATDHVNVKLKDTAVDGTMMASVPTFSEYGISKIEPIFKIVEGSRSLMSQDSEAKDELLRWHTAVLSDDMDPKETVKMLLEDPYVETAELDYIRKIDSTTPTEITDLKMSDQWYLGNTKINEAWAHLESQGINPGGSRDVVVAVIDTGVDSAHPDLTANMWVNTGEVPGNNIDDDGNGYIDDINGASTVGNAWAGESGVSLDDHGHGTHVAGIIAASANDGGMTGIAYNTQIMSIKAAQSSGVLTSSDIVEAIYYAVDKGADVINMSFGGYGQNQLEEDALAVAFGQAVLVAAAGNDSKPNVPHPYGRDMFPAAYPWVLGVMAENQYPDKFGDYLAGFSNWDWIPQDSHEYELMAPGVDILSTLPNGEYAKWDGTSMAAPVVSGIAALLRSKFADVNSYSSRFIMGQLASTGEIKQGITYDPRKLPIKYHSVDAFNALTDTPEPNLSYLEHYIFDSETLDPNNNNDGVVDAGEVLDLALVIRNHWGKADNVQVTIDTKSSGGMDDPYVTLINNTVNYGAVGNFGTDDNGLIIENDVVVGVENAFKIKIADNTPNDHLVPINITLTCSNGFDPADTTVYTFNSGFNFLVRRGTVVPNVISEDMTLTNDKYWIIPNATLVEEGATLTIEPGTQVQFWSSEPEGPYSEKAMAYLKVEGTLNVNGTAEEPVEMFTSGFFEGYEIKLYSTTSDGSDDYKGKANINYCKILNPYLRVNDINHCYFTQELADNIYRRNLSNGIVETYSYGQPFVFGNEIANSIFYKLGCYLNWTNIVASYLQVDGNLKNNLFDSCILYMDDKKAEGNVFLKNYKLYGQQYGDRHYYTSQAKDFAYNIDPNSSFEVKFPIKNNANGSTYFLVYPRLNIYGKELFDTVENFANFMGGHIVTINDASENSFLYSYLNNNGKNFAYIGLNDFEIEGQFKWVSDENSIYTNWNYDYDTYNSDSEDVVAFYYGSRWKTLNDNSYPYIIEVPGAIDTNLITLNKHELTLGEIGYTYKLEAIFTPDNVTNKNIIWSSSNSDVATVDSNGNVTPLQSGITTITATAEDGGFSDSCIVTVISGITLNKTETNIYINNFEKLIASVEPSGDINKILDWESENTDIATVDANGNIFGVSPGTTTITAESMDGKIVSTCTVNVLNPVLSVAINQNILSMGVDDLPITLLTTILPVDATNKNIIWSSSNPDVASIDETGTVTSHSIGVATITATTEDGGFNDTCIVNVVKVIPVTGISLNKTETTIYINESKKLIATIEPLDATHKSVIWESSNADVAGVDGDGNVYGNSPGTTIITARTVDGGFAASCTVNVLSPVKGVSLNKSFLRLVVGESTTATALVATIEPVDATNQDVSWFSTNPVVVDVDEDGNLYPMSEGTASIIVTTEDGSYTSKCLVTVWPDETDFGGVNVESGYFSSYAVNKDGTLWSWGNNEYNKLGDGTDIQRNIPVPAQIDNVKQVSVGEKHTLVLKEDGTVWSWGAYWAGQLGRQGNECVPGKVDGLSDIVQISASKNFSMALKSDGTVWSWGSNDYGQLGDGSTITRYEPIQVNNLTDIVQISAGGYHGLALKSDGTVWAWGYNGNGQLGNVTYIQSKYPVQVSNLTNIQKISAGECHSLALNSDGSVWNWGYIGCNQNNTPEQVINLSDIEQISAGNYYSMALKNDGTVWTWGSNGYGQLGDGTTNNANSPKKIKEIDNIISISAGDTHSLAIKSDGTVWAWGINDKGQLGNMTTNVSYIPINTFYGLLPDSESPTVISSNPGSNADDVGINSEIRILFNEEILAGDNFGLISLKDSNGNTVSLKERTIFGNTITLRPIKELVNNMVYTVNIPYFAVIDLFNNTFDNNYTFNFTTEDLIENSNSIMNDLPTIQLLDENQNTSLQGLNDNGQFMWTQEDLDAKRLEIIESGQLSTIKNNAILNRWNDPDPSHWMRFTGNENSGYQRYISNNYWGTTSEFLISKAIIDFNDFMTLEEVIYKPFLTEAPESCYPFVTDVYVTNSSGDTVTEVGAEPIQIHVLFNRDMDESVQPEVNFGPDLPTTDYTVNAVDGGWTSPRHWIGEMTITPITGDGYQFFRVAGAVAAHDPWLVTGNDSERFGFEIITSGTEAMNLQATGGENKVDLMWTQDDFDLLAGYNLYRSTSMDGEYTKINTTVIPSEQKNYTDTNVLPGQQYFYKFKVVKTDLTESDFSNVASATPNDTIAPVIAHTPVQSAVPGLPLQIYADVTDNVRVETVTLYYRTSNKDNPVEYTTLPMIKTTGNRYSATVGGSSVAVPGLEYYIEASDGTTLKRSGRADLPYLVLVTDAPKITSISPAISPTSGGTNVVITGTNFKEGATVTFGNAVASNVVVVSSTRITAVTPSHLPAQVDVKVTNANGYSSSLLLGFNYESDGVEVSISDINANVGQIIEVPININNVNGLIGADMKITYNPDLLSFRGARKGNLTSNFWLEGNSNVPGEVNISCSSATPTSGTGSLAIMEFEVLSSEIKTSDIAFESILINDGSINVNVINGKFILSDLYEINGNIYYYKGGYTVNNVNLKLDGSRTYSTTSANYGTYKISGIERGDYKLTASKSDEATGISSFDASLILQYITGKTSLDSNQLIAADVNKNGMITAMDASYILQKAVDLISLPFPGAGEVWAFMPSEKTYVDLQSNRTYEDFNAILIGDVTGNWTAGAGLQSISNTEIFTGDIRTEGLNSIVPVGIECNKENIYALDLTVSYDPTIAKFISAEGLTTYENLIIVTNETVPGTVKIALASDEPILSGKLLDLRFSMQGEGEFNVKVNTADANENQATLLIEGYISTGLISHFVFEKDGKKIVVPLADATGYAYAYSTQNELYQYLRGSNSTPLISGLLSGTKYMPVGGFKGYAINYSLNDTAKEAMQYTPWFSKEEYNTYFLFEGFDLGGNAILTPINQ